VGQDPVVGVETAARGAENDGGIVFPRRIVRNDCDMAKVYTAQLRRLPPPTSVSLTATDGKVSTALLSTMTADAELHPIAACIRTIGQLHRHRKPALIASTPAHRSCVALLAALATSMATADGVQKRDAIEVSAHYDNNYTSRLPGEPAAGVTDLHFHPWRAGRRGSDSSTASEPRHRQP
jgi:hypothetical protein